MIKSLRNKKIYKKLLIIGIIIYVSYVFIGQQKTLNSYKNREEK